jgi:riboflavin kinase/FMN adenylyltransferase
MKVLWGIEHRVSRPTCLALGVFDGVHRGHQGVIAAAVSQARSIGATPAVLTFDPHPAAVVAPRGSPPLLTTTNEKIESIRQLGVKLVIIAPFDKALADMPAEVFVAEVLVRQLRARCVTVGFDWRFGAGGRGTPALLKRLAAVHGFGVTTIPAVVAKGLPVSSTRIRGLLLHGRVEEANELLGRTYSLTGRVVAGHRLGRTLGFPTANLDPPAEKLIPADGVYACWAGACPPHGQRSSKLWPALGYIGSRPTFGGDGRRRVEVHLLQRRGPVGVRGASLRTEFVSRLRRDRRFPSAEALVAQMQADRVGADVILGALQRTWDCAIVSCRALAPASASDRERSSRAAGQGLEARDRRREPHSSQ